MQINSRILGTVAASAAGLTVLSDTAIDYPHLSPNVSGVRYGQWGATVLAEIAGMTLIGSGGATEATRKAGYALMIGAPIGVFSAQAGLNVLRVNGAPSLHTARR